MKRYIKILAPVLLGFFFIYLTVNITTSEELVSPEEPSIPENN